MRIAWTSNAPWCKTGYGVQTKQVIPMLARDGHQIAVMANYGLAGADMDFDGIPVMGAGFDIYSNDLTPHQIKQWLGDWKSSTGTAITLYDVWVYSSQDWLEFPIAAWVPIDHKNVPEAVRVWLAADQEKRFSLAMSKFGKKEMLEAGINPETIYYIPHSVDTSVFKPEVASIRAAIGVPEKAHLTLINSMNKGKTPVRKCFPEMLQAWCEFAKDKEDAYLYMHVEPQGIANGINLMDLINNLDYNRKNRIIITKTLEYRRGLAEETMASLYASSDVLLMTSRGEGFGVPSIEAQACGTPVIVTDWTAQTELCGAGWLVDGQQEWDHLQHGWWKVPNISQITEALDESYKLKRKPSLNRKHKEKSVAFAKKYDTKIVYNRYWRPTLESLEQKLSKIR